MSDTPTPSTIVAQTTEPKKFAEVEKSFTYQSPKPGQPEIYKELRDNAKQLAFNILNRVPPSREQSLAITKLEESIMWANKGIALHG